MTKEHLITKGYEFKGKVLGKLKWTDGRDGKAVLIDSNGNEYYCEQSSSPLFDFMNNKSIFVEFEIVFVPNYGLIAWNAQQMSINKF